jgi:hypothetical protein
MLAIVNGVATGADLLQLGQQPGRRGDRPPGMRNVGDALGERATLRFRPEGEDRLGDTGAVERRLLADSRVHPDRLGALILVDVEDLVAFQGGKVHGLPVRSLSRRRWGDAT